MKTSALETVFRPTFRSKGLTKKLFLEIISLVNAGYNEAQIGQHLGISDDSWKRWRKNSSTAACLKKWTIYRRLFNDIARIRGSDKRGDLESPVRAFRKFYKVTDTGFYDSLTGKPRRIVRKITEVQINLKILRRLEKGRPGVLGGAKKGRLKVKDLIPDAPFLSAPEWNQKYGRGSPKELSQARPAPADQHAPDFSAKKIKALKSEGGIDQQLRAAFLSLAHEPRYESVTSWHFSADEALLKKERKVREFMPCQSALNFLVNSGVETHDPGELSLPKGSTSWEDCAENSNPGLPLSICCSKMLLDARMEPEAYQSSGSSKRRRRRIIQGPSFTSYVQIKNKRAEREWKTRAAAPRMAYSKQTEGQDGMRSRMRSREERTIMETASQKWLNVKTVHYSGGLEKRETFNPGTNEAAVIAGYRNLKTIHERRRKDERKVRMSPVAADDEYRKFIPPDSIISGPKEGEEGPA